MNIYEKLLSARQEIGYLKKDGKVSFKETSYKAITDEKVTSTVRPILDKYRIMMTIDHIDIKHNGTLTEALITWRFTDVDNPQDFILVQSAGHGTDTQDKGAGKAMTYSRKYAILNTLLIPTGEDPDRISSEELDYRQEEDELGKLRGQILDLADGDIERVNTFLGKMFKQTVKLEDMNLEQLTTVRDIIAKRLGKE